MPIARLSHRQTPLLVLTNLPFAGNLAGREQGAVLETPDGLRAIAINQIAGWCKCFLSNSDEDVPRCNWPRDEAREAHRRLLGKMA